MARYTEAKCRLCRREGMKLFLKGERCSSPKCPIDSRGSFPPGQHGQKNRRKMSDYGSQLREKQKAKRFYGILERQFKRYYTIAKKKKGATGEALLLLLETRLDNVLSRLGFAASRSTARQLIAHKHVMVNGKVLDISSYILKPNDVVTFTTDVQNNPAIKKATEGKSSIPAWLEKKALVGKVLRLPKREEVEVNINEQLIVEFYSR